MEITVCNALFIDPSSYIITKRSIGNADNTVIKAA